MSLMFNNGTPGGLPLAGNPNAPYTISFWDPSGFTPGTWSDDGVGNMTFAPANSLTLSLPAGVNYVFDSVNGLQSPGFTANLTGDVTCHSLTLSLPGVIADSAGNLYGTSLSIGGKVVISGQMPSMAALSGSATLAQVITAFNTLLAALKTAGLMASP
jgi:enamine deaminase RidA (YjgF/YER057c/UK114 family)